MPAKYPPLSLDDVARSNKTINFMFRSNRAPAWAQTSCRDHAGRQIQRKSGSIVGLRKNPESHTPEGTPQGPQGSAEDGASLILLVPQPPDDSSLGKTGESKASESAAAVKDAVQDVGEKSGNGDNHVPHRPSENNSATSNSIIIVSSNDSEYEAEEISSSMALTENTSTAAMGAVSSTVTSEAADTSTDAATAPCTSAQQSTPTTVLASLSPDIGPPASTSLRNADPCPASALATPDTLNGPRYHDETLSLQSNTSESRRDANPNSPTNSMTDVLPIMAAATQGHDEPSATDGDEHPENENTSSSPITNHQAPSGEEGNSHFLTVNTHNESSDDGLPANNRVRTQDQLDYVLEAQEQPAKRIRLTFAPEATDADSAPPESAARLHHTSSMAGPLSDSAALGIASEASPQTTSPQTSPTELLTPATTLTTLVSEACASAGPSDFTAEALSRGDAQSLAVSGLSVGLLSNTELATTVTLGPPTLSTATESPQDLEMWRDKYNAIVDAFNEGSLEDLYHNFPFFSVLKTALDKKDTVFILLSQVFHLMHTDEQLACQLLGIKISLILPIIQAFSLLPFFSHSMPSKVRKLFAAFPIELDEFKEYRTTLPQPDVYHCISECMMAHAIYLPHFLDIAVNRGYPLMIREARYRLRITSNMLARIVFISSFRRMGIFENHKIFPKELLTRRDTLLSRCIECFHAIQDQNLSTVAILRKESDLIKESSQLVRDFKAWTATQVHLSKSAVPAPAEGHMSSLGPRLPATQPPQMSAQQSIAQTQQHIVVRQMQENSSRMYWQQQQNQQLQNQQLQQQQLQQLQQLRQRYHHHHHHHHQQQQQQQQIQLHNAHQFAQLHHHSLPRQVNTAQQQQVLYTVPSNHAAQLSPSTPAWHQQPQPNYAYPSTFNSPPAGAPGEIAAQPTYANIGPNTGAINHEGASVSASTGAGTMHGAYQATTAPTPNRATASMTPVQHPDGLGLFSPPPAIRQPQAHSVPPQNTAMQHPMSQEFILHLQETSQQRAIAHNQAMAQQQQQAMRQQWPMQAYQGQPAMQSRTMVQAPAAPPHGHSQTQQPRPDTHSPVLAMSHQMQGSQAVHGRSTSQISMRPMTLTVNPYVLVSQAAHFPVGQQQQQQQQQQHPVVQQAARQSTAQWVQHANPHSAAPVSSVVSNVAQSRSQSTAQSQPRQQQLASQSQSQSQSQSPGITPGPTLALASSGNAFFQHQPQQPHPNLQHPPPPLSSTPVSTNPAITTSTTTASTTMVSGPHHSAFIKRPVAPPQLRRPFVPKPGKPIHPHHYPRNETQRMRTAIHSSTAAPPMFQVDTAVEEPEDIYFQYVSRFAVPPTPIEKVMQLAEAKFTLSTKDAELLARKSTAPGFHELKIRKYRPGSLIYQVRMCYLPSTFNEEVSLSQWLALNHVWATPVTLKVNSDVLHAFPYKEAFKHDLPYDISHHVVQGDNSMTVGIFKESPGVKMYFAVEVVEIQTCAAVTNSVSQNVFSAKSTLSIVAERLSSSGDGDDDDVMASGNTIGISLCDPFSLKALHVPVRGALCNHLDCFDLHTWLVTRPVSRACTMTHGRACLPKSPCAMCQRRAAGMRETPPTDVDKWKCPMYGCSEDASPHSLRVDEFLLGVCGEVQRKKLESSVQAVLVGKNGEYEIKMADDDGNDAEYEALPAKSKSKSKSKSGAGGNVNVKGDAEAAAPGSGLGSGSGSGSGSGPIVIDLDSD